MRSNMIKSVLKKSGLAAVVLLLGSGASFAQTVVGLTAGPATASLPDGSAVPMWGYTCDAVSLAAHTCAALNPNAGLGGWSPVVITVPSTVDALTGLSSTSLTINLTNNLTFTPTGGTANTVPTSLVIVGQLGGGLGSTATSTLSPNHTNAQATVTWPIVGPATAPGTPPAQGTRVQSFSTEVAVGTPASVCWGVACTVPTPALKPGTYLIESGTHPSIQGPMGLYGILVVTQAPALGAAGTAYPAVGANAAVTYSAEIPLLLSEIDPLQNSAVQAAVNTAGFSETKVWSGLPGGCGNALNLNGSPNTTYQTCYPPAVNYTPLYYLVNGAAFDKTHSTYSLFATTPAAPRRASPADPAAASAGHTAANPAASPEP